MGRQLLNATQLRTLKTPSKDKKYFDGGGLYLLARPNGSKLWRFDYRFAGKRKTLAIGKYPIFSLSEARKKHLDAQNKLAHNIDPSSAKKELKQGIKDLYTNQTFESMYRGWLKDSDTKAESTYKKIESLVGQNVVRFLGPTPVSKLRRKDFVVYLDKMAARGATHSAKRTATYCHEIMKYAADKGYIEQIDTQELPSSIRKRENTQHRPSIINPTEFGQLLIDIENYSGCDVIRTALALAPLLFQRPGELTSMEWSEIDFNQAIWTIPKRKMKTRNQILEDHIVPLSSQALAHLNNLKATTSKREYVFPNQNNPKTMIPTESLAKALRALGYCTKTVHCTHGFRASARTMLEEQLKIDPIWIEHQLSHKVKDKNGHAYNRTSFVSERKQMMQIWANYCDDLKSKNFSSTNS